MKTLQEKVQTMLEGERKRRKVAIKFIESITEILVPVAEDIWGDNDQGMTKNSVWISKDEKGQRKYTDYYFRYSESKHESEGFYFSSESIADFGVNIKDLRGADFWSAIRIIYDWVFYVMDLMESRSDGREKLLDKIKRLGETLNGNS